MRWDLDHRLGELQMRSGLDRTLALMQMLAGSESARIQGSTEFLEEQHSHCLESDMHRDPLPVREPAAGQTDQRPGQEELVAGRTDFGSIAEERAGTQAQPLQGHHNFGLGGSRTVESMR